MAQLIIGLGNPGGEYAHTRHNVGWMCLDELERRGKFGRERREGAARVREGTIDGYDVLTARPQTQLFEIVLKQEPGIVFLELLALGLELLDL